MRRIKSTFFLLQLFALLSVAYGQTDSVALGNGPRTTKEIAPGVKWITVHFSKNELFRSNQNINFIEISPGAKNITFSIAHSDSLETTSQIALRTNALAAINGSFFKMRGADPDYNPALNTVPKMAPSRLDYNRSIVYLREKGRTIAENQRDNNSKRKRHLQGTLAIGSNHLSILRADSVEFNWEHTLTEQDVISSGPLMLVNGKYEQIPNDAFCNDRHPRTAVGKKADGTVLLFVVGRAAESAGMSIPELQRTLKWLGCVDALNLDGGGSTTMYIKGAPFRGVVNYPTDNKKFDHEGEREVANIILVLSNH